MTSAAWQVRRLRELFDERWAQRQGPLASGVWRYRELVSPCAQPVTRPEGNTNLYELAALADWASCPGLILKHEGENPTAFLQGQRDDRRRLDGCARSAPGPSSAHRPATHRHPWLPMRPWPACPASSSSHWARVSAGKLAQSIAYGARVIQIEGDFDAALSWRAASARTWACTCSIRLTPGASKGRKPSSLS